MAKEATLSVVLLVRYVVVLSRVCEGACLCQKPVDEPAGVGERRRAGRRRRGGGRSPAAALARPLLAAAPTGAGAARSAAPALPVSDDTNPLFAA